MKRCWDPFTDLQLWHIHVPWQMQGFQSLTQFSRARGIFHDPPIAKKNAYHVYHPGHKQYYRSVVEMSQYNHRALLFDLYRMERICISCGLGCENCLQTKAGRTSLTASSTSQTWQSEHSNRHQFSKMVSLQKKIRTGFFVQQLCCLMNVKRDVWQPAEKQGSFEPCSIVRGTGFLLGISPLTFPWAICCIPVSGM